MKTLMKVNNAYKANNNMNDNRFKQSFKNKSVAIEKEEKTPFQKVLNEKIKKKAIN